MSRKLKYGEPTKTVGFKVPLSKEEAVKKLVKDYLNPCDKNYTTDGKEIKGVAFGVVYINEHCGCIIENGLLKRAKNSKCKLTKSEH